MENIHKLVSLVRTYPLNEIFYLKQPNQKAHNRIEPICAELFSFNSKKRYLSNLSYSYHELSCSLHMANKIGFINKSFMQGVIDKFLEDSKLSISAMDETYKKDQLLQEFYKPLRVSFDLIKTDIYNMTKTINMI